MMVKFTEFTLVELGVMVKSLVINIRSRQKLGSSWGDGGRQTNIARGPTFKF